MVAKSKTRQNHPGPSRWRNIIFFALSFFLVLCLAVLANRLQLWGNKPFGRALIEYPLWAVILGLLVSLVLRGTGAYSKINSAFRTELFLKTGLVLLGASVNFATIMKVGYRGLIQSAILVVCVFFFTWYIGRLFKLDLKLRALMATSNSICGVSAAIAAAGAILAKREHLAYVTTLVILFAMPLMVLEPIFARMLNLPDAVAGAWIGGNIDTTAAVVGAGSLYNEQAMQIASIVKLSQNSLIGFAAFFLALYWVVVVEKKADKKPSPKTIWTRFPKFVLGFMAVSLIATLGLLPAENIKIINNLRTWFLTLAFVSIGLEFAFGEIKRIGSRPILVYGIATLFNVLLALGLAWVLFNNFGGI
ncbi:MAG: putative sulfate exporter family transporter [Dehalococcoidia bacterium]|nr:putative sulfate exporter family transporter [Dehalococcoidia bacterium]MDZ4245544.1 putative sulfate exporter family transporter [Dehalococcoidia bacterium]